MLVGAFGRFATLSKRKKVINSNSNLAKECECMKKQLRGIALILFGILLAVIGIVDELFSAGDYYMILCIAGVVCGIVGVIMTFVKE